MHGRDTLPGGGRPTHQPDGYSEPAPGVDPKQAKVDEKRRAFDARHGQHVDRLQQIARERGRDDFIERLEQKRVEDDR
ncbi:MAG: hypothetical protein ACR2LJ_10695 [Acidimicrobiales bacterium]